MNSGIIIILGGAGFCPSRVSPILCVTLWINSQWVGPLMRFLGASLGPSIGSLIQRTHDSMVVFWFPLIGGRGWYNPPIGSIYHLYTTYILPFWGVICYRSHLLVRGNQKQPLTWLEKNEGFTSWRVFFRENYCRRSVFFPSSGCGGLMDHVGLGAKKHHSFFWISNRTWIGRYWFWALKSRLPPTPDRLIAASHFNLSIHLHICDLLGYLKEGTHITFHDTDLMIVFWDCKRSVLTKKWSGEFNLFFWGKPT